MTIELFAFIETDIFHEDLLEIADDELFFEIQNALLRNPFLGDVIQGTHGARKGRLRNPKSNKGKSSGFRFIYLYLEKSARIYLLMLFSKKEKSDLSPEQKKQLGEIVLAIKRIHKEV